MPIDSYSEPLCIPLPTPYPVGRVNSYLLPDSPACLVDVGVKSERSINELTKSLSERRRSIEEIDSILLTHRHNDHAGAAPAFARDSGITINCHEESILDEPKARETFLELISCYGAPNATLDQLRMAWEISDQFGEPLTSSPSVKTVGDGERISAGGLELEALLTPGHASGHLCYVARERGLIFCGDLLLAEITSNPLPHFDETAPRGRQVSLSLYLESLEKVEALGPLRGLPGHGSALADTTGASKRAREHILARNGKVLRLIRSWPGARLFELAAKFFFQEQNVLGQTLAFCELLAHADLLEERGKIIVDPETGVPEIVDVRQDTAK